MAIKFETDSWRFIPAKYFKKMSGRAVRLIVIHSAETLERNDTAENVANYFATTTRLASAHVTVDNNSVVQSVKDSHIAYAAPGSNHDGVHVELAGKAAQSRDEWLDPYGIDLLNNAAEVVAQYCLKYDIPAKHLSNDELRKGQRGIVGHLQVSLVYRKSSHTDPGPHFPWQYFLSLVEHFIEERVKKFAEKK